MSSQEPEDPLRGEGIEIRFNPNKSDPDRRKYNVHVHEDLYAVFLDEAKKKAAQKQAKDETTQRDGAKKARANKKTAKEAHDERSPEGQDQERYGYRLDDAGRIVIGYLVTDEDFEAAVGDDHC